MALPRDQREDVDRLLSEFCETRVPPQRRALIRYEYAVRANSVTLTEPPLVVCQTWRRGRLCGSEVPFQRGNLGVDA